MKLPSWVSLERYQQRQASVVEEILYHYNDGCDLVVLDAPTGAGKTLVAEAVRQSLGTRGLYLCNTLTLMDQFSSDFPEAELVKGRANYTPTHAEPDPWNNLPTCADCDLRDKQCSFCQVPPLCPYTQAKASALTADLACTNTAYFMGECSSERSQFSGHEFVILDEADMAESEVMNHISVSISPRMQKYLDINPPRFKTKEDSWADWFEYAIPYVHRHQVELGTRNLRDRRRKATLKRLVDRMKNVAENLEGWVYTGYEKGAIEFKPVTVEQVAPEALWQHGKRWLAMSATIISPEEFVSSLGYDKQWASVFAPSTFAAERRPIYFFPAARMVDKQKEQSWPEMAKTLKVVLDRHRDERVLVHTHSYALTNFLRTHLEEDELDAGPPLPGEDGREVFYYLDPRERMPAIANFERTDKAVLLAPSLDRGYDGVDDKVRVVVIAKTMFPYLGDKQVSTRLYSTKGGKLWYAVQTARAMVQAAGRGMRHEEDSCTIYILDSVFSSFFAQWDGWGNAPHRLLPSWFCDALHFESGVRFEIRQELRRREQGGVSTLR